jgi:hypothetical protein
MSNLPPKNDPERADREREAIKARDKAAQVTGALKEGKLPTTGQVTRTIETVQSSDALHEVSRGMSPLGKKVLADTEKLLDTTKKIFEEKNVGDELQHVIYHTGKATKDTSTTVTVPDDLKNKANNEAASSQPLVQDALRKTMMIPQLLISSSEFRKLINDLHSIIQDALLRAIPGKDPSDINAGVGSDQEKTIEQAKNETAQQAREGTFPVAKEAADITGKHVKDFSEGKGAKETATDGAKHLATHFKDKFSGYQLTEEQRDRLVNRFKNTMIETQSKPEYQSVLEDLINIISRINEQSQHIAGQAKESAKTQAGSAADKSDIQIAHENAKRLIENFANHKSLDPLIDALKTLGKDIRNDEELRSYINELREFTLSSLRDPKFVQETDYVEHGSKLIDRGRYLFLERYSDHTHRIADEASAFNEALQNDTLTSQWARDFETLVRDLFLDERGQPTVKFELIKDFAKILKLTGEKMKYLPLPRIENSDEEYDYIFDNIVLYLADVLPKHLRMNFTADINLDREEKDILQNTAYIEISKINADARNIAFYYKKKKGLINMMDVGLVDFSIPKNGLTIKLKVLMNPPNEANPTLDLRVLESDTIIDDLKIRLHDTKHDILNTILTPLVVKQVKKQVSKMISEKIAASVEYIKENLSTLQSQILKQVNDRRGKTDEGHHVDNKGTPGHHVDDKGIPGHHVGDKGTQGHHVGDEKKQKQNWQGHNLNNKTQVREE